MELRGKSPVLTWQICVLACKARCQRWREHRLHLEGHRGRKLRGAPGGRAESSMIPLLSRKAFHLLLQTGAWRLSQPMHCPVYSCRKGHSRDGSDRWGSAQARDGHTKHAALPSRELGDSEADSTTHSCSEDGEEHSAASAEHRVQRPCLSHVGV